MPWLHTKALVLFNTTAQNELLPRITKKSPFTIGRFSVILEIPQPFGPIAGLDAAGLRPGTVNRILAMPFQRPQLLESDASDRPVHKEHVDPCLVPAEGKVHHFIGVVDPLAVKLRGNDAVEISRRRGRLTGSIAGSAPSPHRIGKNRDSVGLGHVFMLPVPGNRTALNGARAFRVIEPVVAAVAGFFPRVKNSPRSHDVSMCRISIS